MGMLHTYDFSQIQNYRICGRTTSSCNPITLFWTGSGIELNLKAGELWMELESNYVDFEQWISVFIDGALLSRMMLPKGKHDICIFRHMNPELTKQVRICKEVQAMPGDGDAYIQIHSVTTDGEFLPLEPKTLRLEIIGDSLTSGEGSIGAQTEQDWISMFFTACHGYPMFLEQELNADVRVISQSGWGVSCSWDNNPNCTLPSIYEKICGPLSSRTSLILGSQLKHDFSTWQPDIILVSLGTNDSVAFEQPAWISSNGLETFKQILLSDGTPDTDCTNRFEHAVTAFLKKLRFCNPDAFILWAYGMFENRMEPYLKNGIKAYQYQTQDEKVKFLMLPETPAQMIGARNHPGVLAHQRAADILAKEIKALIK